VYQHSASPLTSFEVGALSWARYAFVNGVFVEKVTCNHVLTRKQVREIARFDASPSMRGADVLAALTPRGVAQGPLPGWG